MVKKKQDKENEEEVVARPDIPPEEKIMALINIQRIHNALTREFKEGMDGRVLFALTAYLGMTEELTGGNIPDEVKLWAINVVGKEIANELQRAGAVEVRSVAHENVKDDNDDDIDVSYVQ